MHRKLFEMRKWYEVRALYYSLLLMKLPSSIHSFYNRVLRLCSESLAVQKIMNWFSSGFCMYGLGHADWRAPHIFVSLHSHRPWTHFIRFLWAELTHMTIRLGLFVFNHFSKIYLVLFEHELPRRENNMYDSGKTILFFSPMYFGFAFSRSVLVGKNRLFNGQQSKTKYLPAYLYDMYSFSAVVVECSPKLTNLPSPLNRAVICISEMSRCTYSRAEWMHTFYTST